MNFDVSEKIIKIPDDWGHPSIYVHRDAAFKYGVNPEMVTCGKCSSVINGKLGSDVKCHNCGVIGTAKQYEEVFNEAMQDKFKQNPPPCSLWRKLGDKLKMTQTISKNKSSHGLVGGTSLVQAFEKNPTKGAVDEIAYVDQMKGEVVVRKKTVKECELTIKAIEIDLSKVDREKNPSLFDLYVKQLETLRNRLQKANEEEKIRESLKQNEHVSRKTFSVKEKIAARIERMESEEKVTEEEVKAFFDEDNEIAKVQLKRYEDAKNNSTEEELTCQNFDPEAVAMAYEEGNLTQPMYDIFSRNKKQEKPIKIEKVTVDDTSTWVNPQLKKEYDDLNEVFGGIGDIKVKYETNPKEWNIKPKASGSSLYMNDIVEDFISWQGEGLHMGSLMYFIRFRVCKRLGNKPLCSFCDTQKRTCKLQPKKLYISDIINNLKAAEGKVLFTGGEPTLYVNEIAKLFNYIKNILRINISEFLKIIMVESNGYDMGSLVNLFDEYDDFNGRIIFSPKIFDNEDLEFNINALEHIKEHSYRIILKVLISSDNESNALARCFIDAALKYIDHSRVWIMPLGDNIKTLNESYVHALKVAGDYRFNLSSRLHVIHNFE